MEPQDELKKKGVSGLPGKGHVAAPAALLGDFRGAPGARAPFQGPAPHSSPSSWTFRGLEKGDI